jgi:hypothetical protein
MRNATYQVRRHIRRRRFSPRSAHMKVDRHRTVERQDPISRTLTVSSRLAFALFL